MTAVDIRKDPLIETGCLIPSAIAIAFFAFIAYSHPRDVKVALGYIALIIGIMVTSAVIGRFSPYSQAAARFTASELARLQKVMGERISTVRELTPRQFEQAVGRYFSTEGWDVEVTQATGDGGKDLILRKGEVKVLVEVKQFGEGKKVGRPAVMKLHSAVVHERATTGIFVTTSEYTRQAEEFASLNQLRLINGAELGLLLEAAFPNADSLPYIRVMCHKCGAIEVYGDLSVPQITCPQGHKVANPVPLQLRSSSGPPCVDCNVPLVRVRLKGSRSGRYVCPQCRQPHPLERGHA